METSEKSALDILREEIDSNSIKKAIDDMLCAHIKSMLANYDLISSIPIVIQHMKEHHESNGVIFLPNIVPSISNFEEIEEAGEQFVTEIQSWCAQAIEREIGIEKRYQLVNEIFLALESQTVYNKDSGIDRRAEHPEIKIPEDAIIS